MTPPHSSFGFRHSSFACLLTACVLALASPAQAAYDFTGLTALANGALAGQNVGTPVPGFEIRLLKHGVPIYHEVFGDWSLNRPANVDSSTKTISGALMMSVADSADGGFSLDSHLADFLPEYNVPGFRDITIRQAFSHTSGIAGDEQALVLYQKNITLRQAAAIIKQTPLAYTPGSAFSYGGLSMQVAGAAAEVATGQNYIDLFAERLATPLGMTSTRFVLASDTNPRIAGGVESTASDYSRFMDMLANDGVDRVTGVRILSSAAVNEMFTRQTNDSQPIINSPADNNYYGVGIWVNQLAQAGPSAEALAAGARGFHSWIDRRNDLVFTFATDLSHFANVEVLSSMMHAEILSAVPAADFDFDGDVDAADFSIWQTAYGATAQGDANNDGQTDGADFLEWQRRFTLPTNTAAAQSRAASVPEPASAALALYAAAAMALLALRHSPAYRTGESSTARP
ncbi:serine hydrolase domain-containing protein [Lacipirellula limnantheis]|uniref:D-alanyl-D-alanine carboxypeptidase n=1 Tax=Lacipirellula limnantheis TaxID=2528024 RepID=A0A517U5N8_9BACT|nr:serine hydrolase domain-containing protein [Lacipirellula limnantheis]QDT75923.1 D-alanyl-D-alanine carboxypeptidase precursor [Lacipirellula limnantheis]